MVTIWVSSVSVTLWYTRAVNAVLRCTSHVTIVVIIVFTVAGNYFLREVTIFTIVIKLIFRIIQHCGVYFRLTVLRISTILLSKSTNPVSLL